MSSSAPPRPDDDLRPPTANHSSPITRRRNGTTRPPRALPDSITRTRTVRRDSTQSCPSLLPSPHPRPTNARFSSCLTNPDLRRVGGVLLTCDHRHFYSSHPLHLLDTTSPLCRLTQDTQPSRPAKRTDESTIFTTARTDGGTRPRSQTCDHGFETDPGRT